MASHQATAQATLATPAATPDIACGGFDAWFPHMRAHCESGPQYLARGTSPNEVMTAIFEEAVEAAIAPLTNSSAVTVMCGHLENSITIRDPCASFFIDQDVVVTTKRTCPGLQALGAHLITTSLISKRYAFRHPHAQLAVCAAISQVPHLASAGAVTPIWAVSGQPVYDLRHAIDMARRVAVHPHRQEILASGVGSMLAVATIACGRGGLGPPYQLGRDTVCALAQPPGVMALAASMAAGAMAEAQPHSVQVGQAALERMLTVMPK